MEGIYAFYRLLQVPRDLQGGLSAIVSVFLLAMSAVLTLALLAALYYSWRWPQKKLLGVDPKQHSCRLITLSLLALAAIPLTIITHQVLHNLYLGTDKYIYRLAFDHLDPFLLWVGLAAAQFWGWVLLTRFATLKELWQHNRKTCRTALLIWMIFLLTALIVRLSGLRVPETSMTAWAVPAVPLLEWHIWLSGLAAALFFILDKPAVQPVQGIGVRLQALLRSDRFWFLLIWVVSLILWTSQPLLSNHYATPGRAPNFEVYPFSDGLIYDQYAQSILIGNGMMGSEIPARPLYVVFLALMHGLVGQDYHQVILLQTIVLAIFPAVIYLLGVEFHSRSLGIMAAMLTILREIHSIQAAPFTRSVSNVKLYFSEIPTALGLSLFLLFSVRWLKRRKQPGLNPLLAGGMLGITMLIRTQSLAVLPFVLLVGLVMSWPHWKKFTASAALLLVGLLVTIAPWLWRNFQITGALVFDHPMSQNWEMARRYARVFEDDPSTILERRPGENDGDFTQRLNKYIVEAIISHPDYAFKTISTNLANGELTSLLVLPIRPDPLQNWQELFRPRHAFWETWPDSLSVSLVLLLALNMGLIALGIGAAWQKLGWIGLIPLSMNVMYNLATAVFQVSGVRFVLTVQWIAYFYFGLGLMITIEFVWGLLFTAKQRADSAATADSLKTAKGQLVWWQAGLIAALFALVGSSLILSEKVVPQRFQPQNEADILAELQQMPAVQQNPALQEALTQIPADSGLKIYKGRAIYPRYYGQNEIEPDTAKTAYATLNYPRMVFFFLSEERNQVVALPMAQIPEHFPHPLDMILIGCPQELMIEARLMTALDDTQALYISNMSKLNAPCTP
ncbi:MAG: hypothetical protein K8R77_08605 [Anaerolineaceae bacterium]|nr:hypothetical protein [Anaerolineaceae bacterium]